MALNLWKVAKGLFYTPQTAAPSTPDNGSTYFDASLGKFQFRESGSWKGLGSGSAGINYITNPDADTGVTGWATYKDTAGVAPQNGTGGTATHISLTTSSTSPLRGINSFIVANSGATTAQGEGISFDFTIDAADQAKILDISFDYAINSGTFAGGSQGPITVLGDLVVWVYDVTNSTLIQPTPFVLTGSVAGQKYKFQGNFQTASNSTSYRLILHVPTTTILAWSMKFDNVVVGPQVGVFGAPITSPTVFPMVITGTSSNPTKATVPDTDKATWFRIGKFMHIHYEYGSSTGTGGAAGSGTYLFALPLGFQVDTQTVLPDPGQNGGTVGTAQVGTSTDNLAGAVKIYDSTHLVVEVMNNNVAKVQVTSTTYQLSTVGLKYSFDAIVPILGWESNLLMSQDASTRVVAAKYFGMNVAVTNNSTDIGLKWDIAAYDTHGAYVASNGFFVCPVNGKYRVAMHVGSSTNISGTIGSAILVAVKINGVQTNIIATQVRQSTSAFAVDLLGYSEEDCKAGDLITITANNPSSNSASFTTSGSLNSWMTISLIQGPETIVSSESVSVMWYRPNSFSLSTSPQIPTFTQKGHDTHGAWDSTNGIFTAPMAGKYRVTVQIQCSASSSTVNPRILVGANNDNDGFSFNVGTFVYQATGTNMNPFVNGSITFKCVAGSKIQFNVTAESGISGTVVGSDNGYMMIERVGN